MFLVTMNALANLSNLSFVSSSVGSGSALSQGGGALRACLSLRAWLEVERPRLGAASATQDPDSTTSKESARMFFQWCSKFGFGRQTAR